MKNYKIIAISSATVAGIASLGTLIHLSRVSHPQAPKTYGQIYQEIGTHNAEMAVFVNKVNRDYQIELRQELQHKAQEMNEHGITGERQRVEMAQYKDRLQRGARRLVLEHIGAGGQPTE